MNFQQLENGSVVLDFDRFKALKETESTDSSIYTQYTSVASAS